MTSPRSRSISALIATLCVYGALVATHQGEFWPFSIYPMFSQAGHPWSRVVVHEVAADTTDGSWPRPGRPLALRPLGVKANDVAALTAAVMAGDLGSGRHLQRLLAAPLAQHDLLVVRIHGRLEADTVALIHEPVVLLRPDTLLRYPTPAP